jgi:hypothetical protein
LENLLCHILRKPGQAGFYSDEDPSDTAQKWFTDRKSRKEVLELLHHFYLDESAIEAEAIRLAAPDLEVLDKLLASLEARRDKALRHIAEYRGELARQLRYAADRVIEGKTIALEHASSTKAPEAA